MSTKNTKNTETLSNFKGASVADVLKYHRADSARLVELGEIRGGSFHARLVDGSLVVLGNSKAFHDPEEDGVDCYAFFPVSK